MYRKAVVGKVASGSFAVMAVAGLLVLQMGTAYAVPLAGVGGFTIQAEEIRGYGAFIYGDVDDTSEYEKAPMAVTELQRSEIEGLVLTKELDMPHVGPMKIQITATDTVTTDEQLLKFTNLQAETATLRRQVIDETPTDDPSRRFTIAARGNATEGITVDIDENGSKPGLVLQNATINAHYLATNRITLPGQKINIFWDADDDGEMEKLVN